jgi:hypothetical protein
VKRVSLVILAVLVVALVAGCGTSPRSYVKDFKKYVPAQVGDWTRDDKATVELLSSTITNKGHVTMLYNGPDGAIAYVVVEAYPGADAAEVAVTTRERELVMQGLVFEKDRKPPKATADVAQQGRARYAFFQEDQIVVEIDVLAADEATPVSDEAFTDLLTMARTAYAKVLQ